MVVPDIGVPCGGLGAEFLVEDGEKLAFGPGGDVVVFSGQDGQHGLQAGAQVRFDVGAQVGLVKQHN
ncbi:hypothetical protein A5M97_13715 [Streptococcus pneumoniae]|nr:hypothetical protein A5M97_13715 [Streptococcus pneumoniae]